MILICIGKWLGNKTINKYKKLSINRQKILDQQQITQSSCNIVHEHHHGLIYFYLIWHSCNNLFDKQYIHIYIYIHILVLVNLTT